MAFTHVFFDVVFRPLHVLFEYFANILVAIRRACKYIKNCVVLLSPSGELFIRVIWDLMNVTYF